MFDYREICWSALGHCTADLPLSHWVPPTALQFQQMGTEKPLLNPDPSGATLSLSDGKGKRQGKAPPSPRCTALSYCLNNSFIPTRSTCWGPKCVVQRHSGHFQLCILPADATVSKQWAEFNLKHKLCIPDPQELLNKAQITSSLGKEIGAGRGNLKATDTLW